jgi:hypothetical protein
MLRNDDEHALVGQRARHGLLGLCPTFERCRTITSA